jgi:hypothetical protein
VYSFYPSPQIQAIAKANHLVGLAGRLACGPICWLACWLAWGCKPYEPSKPWLLSLLSLRERKRERERERMPKAKGRGGQLGFFWSPKRSGFSQLFRCRPTQMLQTNEQSQTMWFFEAQASQLLRFPIPHLRDFRK